MVNYVQRDISNGAPGPWICFAIVIIANVFLYAINENSVFSRLWGKRGRFLAITNRAFSWAPNPRPQTFFAWDLLDAQHLVTNNPVREWVVLLVRALGLALFAFTLLWQKYGVDKLREGYEHWILYFTNWTFTGFALYALLGCAISIKALLRPAIYQHSWPVPYRFFDKAFLFIFTAICTSSAALTLFYWLFIYTGTLVNVDSPAKHGASFGFMLADLALSRIPVVSYHIVIPVWYGTVYLIFLWIAYSITGRWGYQDLNWNDLANTVYYLGLVLFLMATFGIMYFVAWLRERLGRHLQARKMRSSWSLTLMRPKASPSAVLAEMAVLQPSSNMDKGSGQYRDGSLPVAQLSPAAAPVGNEDGVSNGTASLA